MLHTKKKAVDKKLNVSLLWFQLLTLWNRAGAHVFVYGSVIQANVTENTEHGFGWNRSFAGMTWSRAGQGVLAPGLIWKLNLA